MPFEKRQDPLALRVGMRRAFPIRKAFGTRQQRGEFLADDGGVRRDLAELQAKTRTDAAAQRVKPFFPKMVHQRQMVFRVGMPAMVGRDIAARAPGIALVHRHDAVVRGQDVRPIVPRPGPACHRSMHDRMPPGANNKTGNPEPYSS